MNISLESFDGVTIELEGGFQDYLKVFLHINYYRCSDRPELVDRLVSALEQYSWNTRDTGQYVELELKLECLSDVDSVIQSIVYQEA